MRYSNLLTHFLLLCLHFDLCLLDDLNHCLVFLLLLGTHGLHNFILRFSLAYNPIQTHRVNT